MSEENVDRVRRAYSAMREAYTAGDVESLTNLAEEFCHTDLIFSTKALTRFPRRGEWHGPEGLLKFGLSQMEVIEDMRLEPDDFIDAGDRVLVRLRIGGTARHTGLPVEFSVIHAITYRDGKAARIDVYERLEEALEAAGLSE
jgi:ketosteroid isomerase-like protein